MARPIKKQMESTKDIVKGEIPLMVIKSLWAGTPSKARTKSGERIIRVTDGKGNHIWYPVRLV